MTLKFPYIICLQEYSFMFEFCSPTCAPKRHTSAVGERYEWGQRVVRHAPSQFVINVWFVVYWAGLSRLSICHIAGDLSGVHRSMMQTRCIARLTVCSLRTAQKTVAECKPDQVRSINSLQGLDKGAPKIGLGVSQGSWSTFHVLCFLLTPLIRSDERTNAVIAVNITSERTLDTSYIANARWRQNIRFELKTQTIVINVCTCIPV